MLFVLISWSDIVSAIQSPEALKKFLLFEDAPEQCLSSFLEAGQTMTYPPGSPMVLNDDLGDTFFFVTQGLGKIVLVNVLEEAMNVSLLRSGDFFGELAILENRPVRTANVIALEETSVLVIPKDKFLELFYAYPKLALNMTRIMGERLRHMNERLVAVMLPNTNKVARTILYLSRYYANQARDTALLPVLSISEWADFCNVSQPDFMSGIEELRKMGAVDWSNQKLLVKDVDLLTKHSVHPGKLF